MERILQVIKRFIPKNLFSLGQPIYHYLLSLASALFYGFPSRDIYVIGVTGTKGKTSTVELVNAILEEIGKKTALASTLRFKIGDKTTPNLRKMTMPGRFFTQRFLRKAVRAGCGYAIIEMTSEGTKQFRHKFISLDALIFTNLSPEHIESHGSYEKYVSAKLKIAKALSSSRKKNRIIVVNRDDKEGAKFLQVHVPYKFTYSLDEAKPFKSGDRQSTFTFGNKKILLRLPGVFNIYNALAAATFAKGINIPEEHIVQALERFGGIRGRMEYIDEGQPFDCIVDYAHTADSLEKVYKTLEKSPLVCVLGGTGGGRDARKRKTMGSIADTYCEHIILTNEDPYDEDPRNIIGNIAEGIQNKEYKIIMDRRQAIARACSLAKEGATVIITGKGTDPYIMGAKGNKLPWDDAQVAREEITKIKKTSTHS
ncbi:MAG TPA: UDP-N-acetylmuramoyl-L-alanyl-D-glutamate--2,6-diaminopimelate ligase [Candidatus Yonathbacteria bacterium]|nr:UDP-N-acetylmuramoyl-L-alanyl-D-glutamate--2,6-diaminopimelate ligase [Candidatus Yonathbacteria bacterium]